MAHSGRLEADLCEPLLHLLARAGCLLRVSRQLLGLSRLLDVPQPVARRPPRRGDARRPETRYRQEESAVGPGEESTTDPGKAGKGLQAGGKVRHGGLKGKAVVQGTVTERAGARPRGGAAHSG